MTTGQLLRPFYTPKQEPKTGTNAVIKVSAASGFRHGIERYLNDPPFNRGIKDLKYLQTQISHDQTNKCSTKK